MVIRVSTDLEAVLTDQAKCRGVSVEEIAVEALRDRFLGTARSLEPRDDWERKLFDAALDCGVSVPDWALSGESLYE